MQSTKFLPPECIDFISLEKYPKHDTIWDMMMASNGKLYIALCCEFTPAQSVILLSYDPHKNELKELCNVAHLCGEPPDSGLAPQCKIHFSLCEDENGMIFGATHCTGAPKGYQTWDPWVAYEWQDIRFPGAHIIRHDPKDETTVDLGIVAPNEGVRSMNYDRIYRRLYFITYPRSHMMYYDIETGQVKDLGRVSFENPYAIWFDKLGRAYYADDYAYLVRFDPQTEQFEKLPVRLPCPNWTRGIYCNVFDTVVAPGTNRIYGTTAFNGAHIFSYDPDDGEYGRLIDYGRAWGEDRPGLDVLAEQCVSGLAIRDSYLYYTMSIGPYSHPSFNGTSTVLRMDMENGTKQIIGTIQTPDISPNLITRGDFDKDGFYYLASCCNSPTCVFVIDPHGRGKQRGLTATVTADTSPVLHPMVFANIKSTFVEKGTVQCRNLEWKGMGLPIPDGESAITALHAANKNLLVGGTGGYAAHIFLRFNSATHDFILDAGVIERNGRVTKITNNTSGKILAGTQTADGSSGHLAYIDIDNTILNHRYCEVPLNSLETAVKGGITSIAAYPDSDSFLATTGKGKLILVEENNWSDLNELPGKRNSHSSLVASFKHVYLFRDREYYRIENRNGDMEKAGDLPILKSDKIDSVAVRGNYVAIGTINGNLLFGHLEKGTIDFVCKPCTQKRIRALTFASNGIIYGAGGPPEGVANWFAYDPGASSFKKLGVARTSIEELWVACRFGSAAASDDGIIYFGEDDRISHLFVYIP